MQIGYCSIDFPSHRVPNVLSINQDHELRGIHEALANPVKSLQTALIQMSPHNVDKMLSGDRVLGRRIEWPTD